MYLSQDLDDKSEKIGSKIILSPSPYETDSNVSTNNSSINRHIVLKAGKAGKLYLKPNYTAFTKTNLGSIPSKIEKTLVKTETNIPKYLTLNKIKIKSNQKEETSTKQQRSSSPSFSSKGYGVGFISQVPRFQKQIHPVYPGPGDYNPDKLLTLENEVRQSIFGKSLFFEKKTKSLDFVVNKDNKFYTSQEILDKLIKKQQNQMMEKNNINEDDEKKMGSYFFESKVKRTFGNAFNFSKKSPGPGSYNTDNSFRIKNQFKNSPDFIEPIKKKENPLKYFGIDVSNRKIGFNLRDNKKNGKIINFWNGTPPLGKSYEFGKTLNKIKKNDNNDDKIITFPNYENSKSFKKLADIRFNRERNLTEGKYDNQRDKIKDMENELRNSIFKKKDIFTLSSPRWNDGTYHNNMSHFQVPGPAYYEPKLQGTKKSFNFNKKDFIYTNSVPFQILKFYDIY